MNYKKIFKRETKVIAYVVICLTLVVIGTSYALFLQVNNNSNNQVVTAGSLTITYSGGNTVTVDDTADSNCLLPQSDSDGGGSTGCKFNLSVTNTGTLPMQYNLLIYNNESDAPSGASFVDHAYVRHSLKKQFTVANKSETVTSASSIGSLGNYNSTNKKILETAVIDAGETITFALNIWIDENASTEIIGQYVYLKLDVVGTVYEEETATQALLSDMGNNGISEVMTDTSTLNDSTLATNEYRYTGKNPKNYIYFNCEDSSDIDTCEVWRILGIYNIETDGETESRIKIIKNDSNLTLAWDENGGTTYNTSTINSYLNNDFYNSLSKIAKNQIEDATYKLGGSSALNIDSKEIYYSEVESEESIATKVGLMNLSDYVFASGMDGTLLENISSKNDSNWLYKGNNEWMINKNTNSEIYTITNEGKVATAASTEEKLIRPVVYLASNIKIVSGDGTVASPYVLSK